MYPENNDTTSGSMADRSALINPAMVGATISKQYILHILCGKHREMQPTYKVSLVTADHCALYNNNASVTKFNQVSLHKLPWAFPPTIL